MSRSNYHVTQDDGGWRVLREGGQKASARADTQADAVDRARDLATNNAPGSVYIHGRDGKIREERSYGSDPYPPEG